MTRRALFLSAVLAAASLSATAQRTERTDSITLGGKKVAVRKVSTARLTDKCKTITDSMFINGRTATYTVTNWYAYEGKPMPDFEVVSESGKTLRSAELKGKTVAISFWITSCGPCRKELRRVGDEILSQYPADKFAFLAIGAGEDVDGAKKFRELSGATFELYCDSTNTVFPKFADNGFPKIFVIDKNGVVRYTEDGYTPAKFETLKTQIRNIYNKE